MEDNTMKTMLFVLFASTPVLLNAGGSAGTIEAHHAGTAVIGFPYPIRFVVRGPGEIIDFNLNRNFNPFTIRFSSEDASYVFYPKLYREHISYSMEDAVGVLDGFSPRKKPVPKVKLDKNESSEFTLDLSILRLSVARGSSLPYSTSTILPGRYTLAISHPDFTVQYDTKTLTFVEPNQHEKQFLANISGFGPSLITTQWDQMIRAYKWAVRRGVKTEAFSDAAKSQLAYHMFRLQVLRSESLDKIDLGQKVIEGIPSVYRTDVLMLKLEIELFQEQYDSAEATRNEILSARPHLRQTLKKWFERRPYDVFRHGGLLYLRDIVPGGG